MFFLLYRHPDDGVFDDFPKISKPLSEDFLRFSKTCPKVTRTLPNIPQKLPKISEDGRRLSMKTRRCFDHAPTN